MKVPTVSLKHCHYGYLVFWIKNTVICDFVVCDFVDCVQSEHL